MTTPNTPADQAPFDGYRTALAAVLDHPAEYWQRLAALFSIHISLIQRDHRDCTTPDCKTCAVLADVVAIASAHNSLQFFDEVREEYLPYEVLAFLNTTTATAA